MNQIQRRFMSSTLEYIAKKRKIASELLDKRVTDQKSRKQLKVNQASIQILGDGTQGTQPSLLVNSEGKSYLFNCGAGLQRACFSNRIRLTALEHIFLTSIRADTISGVYGLCLTVSDIGLPSLCIHSTERIHGIFDTMKNITNIGGIQLHERRYPPGFFSDTGLDVQPIIIDLDYGAKLSDLKDPPAIVAYLCKLPDKPGALNPSKCKELKVPIGPSLAKLKSGQDISLEDGTIVKSADVCEPKERGTKFLVVECPTNDTIDSFINCDELGKIVKECEHNNELDLIFHLSPPDITNDNRYQEWMARFEHLNTKHMMINHKISDRIYLVDYRRNQYLLNKLDDQIFSPLYFEKLHEEIVKADLDLPRNGPINRVPRPYEDHDADLPDKKEIKYSIASQFECLEKNHNLYFQDRLVLKPHKHLEKPDDRLDLGATLREVSEFKGFDDAYKHLKDQQKKLPKSEDYEPEIVFLGTGSAVPSKYRNTSGILVNFFYPEPKSVILDCGEDTYGQLIRLYGPIETENILRKLKLIYVSHLHADHNIGLMQLVQKRSELTKEPVALLLPPRAIEILDYHNLNINDMSGTYKVYETKLMKSYLEERLSHTVIANENKSNLYEATENFLKNIQLVEVDHCQNACAVVMEFKIGHEKMDIFKIGYSGDCRPSDQFVDIGQGCDLLIHEATFDDRNQIDAEVKKHCTISEAIDISRSMNAKYTILTHFSQRFAKIPMFTSDFDEKIGFGFDFLRIKCPSHYGRLPILKPILEIVYRESIEMIETKYEREDGKKIVQGALTREQTGSYGG